jgi:hypothetical protein
MLVLAFILTPYLTVLNALLSDPTLGANGNAQQIYELAFILWTLSLGSDDSDLKAFLSAGALEITKKFPALGFISARRIQMSI